jgi:hypothetical protein
MDPFRNRTGRPRLRTIIVFLVAALAVAGCGARDAPTSSSSAAPNSTATASASERTAASSTTGQPSPSHAAERIGPRTFVTSVVDALRVRTLPRIAADSRKLEPLLQRGTALYVLDGPVAASGYSWFQVIPVPGFGVPNGWVAAASRDGEPWLEPTDFGCPSIPTDIQTLSRLRPSVGLACFARIPITVRARVVECGCDIDGPMIAPDWFSSTGGSPVLLIDVAETRPAKGEDWFLLHLDPAAELNADVALGAIVEVTGIFDHPAAKTCTETEDRQTSPSLQCRLTFAVTKLTTVAP